MKPPLMLLPPAQAEALYDAALENDHYDAWIDEHPRIVDLWDDGVSDGTAVQNAAERFRPPPNHGAIP